MAIYMKYAAIKGDATTDGHQGWIELSSFQWGVGRAMGTAARGSTSREHSEPHLSEITISKPMDVATPRLLLDAVAGEMNATVKIDFTTTSNGQTTTFLNYTLENTGISGYSANSSGDMPLESMSLNFTKITTTFTGMNPEIQGTPETVGYDLTQMKTI